MKPSKRARVIAAVDENIFSQVAASVLRNQDYDLIAIHLAVDLQAFGLDATEYPSALRKSNIVQIEKFCSGIDIPLRIIDITEEVLARIYDPFWMTTLTGAPSSATLDWVSGYLMPKLSRLARDYKADSFATGHLARKLEEKPAGILRYVDPTADPAMDQSDSFSRLSSGVDSDILGQLILPLGEVSLNRIVRLAQEMGLLKKGAEDADGKLGLQKLLEDHSARGRWSFTEAQLQNPRVQARAPSEFFKPGPMRSLDDFSSTEHTGIPFYKVGTPVPEFPGQFVLEIRNPSKTLIIGAPSDLDVGRVFLQDLTWNSRPKSVVLDLKVEAEAFGSRRSSSGLLTLFPGGLGDLRLETPLSGLAEGGWLTLYDGPRVLGAGKIAKALKGLPGQIPIEKDAESE